jgi:hypothetical protein
MVEHTVEEITAVEGVEIDFTIRGDEETANRVNIELKDHIGRIQDAFENEVPPTELSNDERENVPLMTVDWESIFDNAE